MSDEKNVINDELHGVLLAAETGIAEAGGAFTTFGLIIGIALAVILSTGYLDELFKVDLSGYQNWGVYIAIPFFTFFIPVALNISLERRTYLKYRSSVLAIAKKSSFNKYKLITIIEGYKKFEHIAKHLKQDTSIDNEWL